MTSVVYVIQVSIGHAEWDDVFLYRSPDRACRRFGRLTGGSVPRGYAFRMVKRVTEEEVLDLWER